MAMTDPLTELKYILSILGYVFIIYPIKRFVYPFFKYYIHEADMLFLVLVVYTGLYLYDFDIQRLATELSTKLVKENAPLIMWFFTPLMTIWAFKIYPLDFIILGFFIVIVIKLYEMVSAFYKQIRLVAGDVLLVTLWCYFTLVGKKELSVMLITSEEAKHKLAMYFLIALVLVISFILVLAPNLLMNTLFPVNIPSAITVNNTTIDSPSYISLVMP